MTPMLSSLAKLEWRDGDEFPARSLALDSSGSHVFNSVRMRRKDCEHICNDGTDCRNFAASQGQGESFTQLVLGNALVLTGLATVRVAIRK
jgi:hypothetical protein